MVTAGIWSGYAGGYCPRQTSDDISVTYTYDKNNLRSSKTVNGVEYSYTYAGDKLMRQSWAGNELYFFYDASGNPTALWYEPENGSTVVGYYMLDQQGNVVRMEDANGNVLASYSYDPWGKIISATGSLAEINPLRYRGYVYDQETGFYYLQSRYYDPAISRFLNADGYAVTGEGGVLGYKHVRLLQQRPGEQKRHRWQPACGSGRRSQPEIGGYH